MFGKPPRGPSLVAAALVVAVVVVVVAVAACAGGAKPRGTGGDVCPIEPERFVFVDEGTVPLVVTSTHAGESSVQGCDHGDDEVRSLKERECTKSLDMVCESGPCRAGGADGGARALTFAIVDDLAVCLGGRPTLVMTEVERSIVDMNRDADDNGGQRCAMQDPAALPYWQAFHRSVEGAVARAVDTAGDNALLIDLHTYVSLPAAPPPAIMIGTGDPVGLTTPHLAAADAGLDVIFGASGLRARLLAGLVGEAHVQVLPSSTEAALDGLFLGRYVVHRYSRRMNDDTKDQGPAIDAVQLEVSSQLRDDADGTARAIAAAVCETFATRLKTPAPPKDSTNVGE